MTKEMNVTLTGASGFIGRRLIDRLMAEAHALHLLGRTKPAAYPTIAFSPWDANSGRVPDQALEGSDAIIHLAGEPVAQRWNPEIKTRIRESRVLGTRALVQALARRTRRPQTFICASAIGYYGDRADEVLDEKSHPGEGFLPEVCVEWEREARAAGNLGMRVVLLRIGIVLGKEGGALKRMLLPFRLGVGGPLGSGKQWMSWIHVDDLVSAFAFLLTRPSLFGPFNTTTPNPVRNAEFVTALGDVLHRPALLPMPPFALRMILGETAEVVLASQRVLPKALEDAGFRWSHPEIHGALKHAV